MEKGETADRTSEAGQSDVDVECDDERKMKMPTSLSVSLTVDESLPPATVVRQKGLAQLTPLACRRWSNVQVTFHLPQAIFW